MRSVYWLDIALKGRGAWLIGDEIIQLIMRSILRFGLTDPESQAFLFPVKSDANDGVDGHRPDMSFGSYFKERGVQIDDGKDGFQRPALPLLGPLQESCP